MDSKKINELATNMSPAATDLTIIADPITGVSKKITLNQIAEIFGGGSGSYVPYTGATANVDLGIYSLTASSLKVYESSGSSGSLVLYTGTTGYNYGIDAISLVSSPTVANTLLISSDVSGVRKIAQIGLGSLSATRTYTLPDLSGTLALLEGTQTFTGANTFNNSVRNEYGTFIKQNQSDAVPSGYKGLFATTNGLEVTNSNTSSAFLNFNNAGNYTYTFPASGGTLALTSDLGAYVTLATTQTISGLKTFTALATNNEAIGIKLTSGVVSTGGYLTLNAKVVGTLHSLFLAPDSTTNRVEITFDNTALRTYALPNASGTIALTSNLSAYLPLSGGTLTGALSGTSATFSSSVTATQFNASYKYAWGSSTSGTTGQIATDNTNNYFDYLGNLYFRGAAASNTLVTFTSGGNVGIGTSSPVSIGGYTALTLNNATTGGILTFQQNGTNKGSIYNDSSNIYFGVNSGAAIFETSGSEKMRITSAGQLQIKQSANAYGDGLRIFNTISNNWTFVNGGDSNLYFGYNSSDRGQFNNSTGVYTPLSDINKKKDFEDSTIGLNAILGLKPTLYRMKSDANDSEKHLGFIAQEVKDFIPQAFVENGNEGNKFIGLNYNAIVAALVKSVQELKAEIEILKNK